MANTINGMAVDEVRDKLKILYLQKIGPYRIKQDILILKAQCCAGG